MSLVLLVFLVTNSIPKRLRTGNIAYILNRAHFKIYPQISQYRYLSSCSNFNNKMASDSKNKKGPTARELMEQEKLALLNKKADNVADFDFGYLPLTLNATNNKRKFLNLGKETPQEGEEVWIRGRLNDVRGKGALSFVILRQYGETIQCVLDAKNPPITKNTIKWTNAVPSESVIDVFGVVNIPKIPIESTSIKFEVSVRKIFCVSKAANELPFQLFDANQPEQDELEESDVNTIRVNPDTRLDNRILDLRTNLSQSVFRVQSEVVNLFRSYLLENEFVEIHTPKLISGNSEGGSSVFTLKYFNRDACLAQSPQLYKQMAVMGDFPRVFEIGPVFRAENSNTHRHLCEFTGLDMEMAIEEDYNELIDLIDKLFKYIFEGVKVKCEKELNAIQKIYPSVEQLQFLETTPRFHFNEAVEILKNEGLIVEGDFNTEQEKYFGKLVKERYKTDYYIIHSYPDVARPFYTMPSHDDPSTTNSFDFFMRGEEILSGAQRVHDPALLRERIKAREINPDTLSAYIDAFKLGAYPHGGCGIGLERFIMLYLGIGNVRKTSMFPRDPKRLTP